MMIHETNKNRYQVLSKRKEFRQANVILKSVIKILQNYKVFKKYLLILNDMEFGCLVINFALNRDGRISFLL